MNNRDEGNYELPHGYDNNNCSNIIIICCYLRPCQQHGRPRGKRARDGRGDREYTLSTMPSVEGKSIEGRLCKYVDINITNYH